MIEQCELGAFRAWEGGGGGARRYRRTRWINLRDCTALQVWVDLCFACWALAIIKLAWQWLCAISRLCLVCCHGSGYLAFSKSEHFPAGASRLFLQSACDPNCDR